ncbi:hypothetical protein ACFQ3Z_04040 [Streptomyces nogalater]
MERRQRPEDQEIRFQDPEQGRGGAGADGGADGGQGVEDDGGAGVGDSINSSPRTAVSF